MWPLALLRRRQRGESAGVPARGLTGGELEVVREHEEVKASRLVGLVRTGAIWLGCFPTARCGGGSEQLVGGRGTAVEWGCGGVWELRDARAVLKAGSAWAEEVWKGGPAAASSSPELRRRGGGALGAWSARPGV